MDETLCPELQGNYLDSDLKVQKFVYIVLKLEERGLGFNGLAKWMKNTEDIRILTNKIITRTKKRCVYIIGSKPEFNSESDAREWELKSEFFIKDITKKLLDRGFHIASFPIVPHVGHIVFHEVWELDRIKQYNIAGIYMIDKEIRPEQINEKVEESVWYEKLLDFRKSYLQDMDFVIIIGGSKGTEEEYRAARDISKKNPIEFIPIPCFNGCGNYIFNTRDSFINHSICMKCIKNTNITKCPNVDKIIDMLLKYEYKD